MKNQALTPRQKDFAIKWHNLIYRFLHSKGLAKDDYYDIVVFGYLRAVRRYFNEAHLQKYAFSTIA